MSKGLSKTQKLVLAILRGASPSKIYRSSRNSRNVLTTDDLLGELVEYGMVSVDDERNKPRKHLLFSVRRACWSLVVRGLVMARYDVDTENGCRRKLYWCAAWPCTCELYDSVYNDGSDTLNRDLATVSDGEYDRIELLKKQLRKSA